MERDHSTWHTGLVRSTTLLRLVLVVAGCDRPAHDRGDGASIYATLCATCHGPTGKPDATMVARLQVRDLTSAELRARISPALVEAQVRRGSPNKLMPSFEGALSDEQIRAVAAYVASPAFVAP